MTLWQRFRAFLELRCGKPAEVGDRLVSDDVGIRSRGIWFSYYKSFKMAWSARHGPDPKVIEVERQYRRVLVQQEKFDDR